MAKARKKTGSTSPRQIAPPSLSQHLREFASRPDAWVVLARNLIRVLGIYGFSWSAYQKWPAATSAPSVRSLAIRPGCTNTIRTIPHRGDGGADKGCGTSWARDGLD